MKKIFISDMTLKAICEEQKSPLSFKEKLGIATKLELAGLNAIELPKMLNPHEDSVIYSTIAAAAKNCMVCVDAGADEQSIELAANAIKAAKQPCLQIVLPVSTAQMEYTYHLKAPKMLSLLGRLVKYAAAFCKVEFVARDASRAEQGFAAEACKTAAQNGASAVTVCDDAGILFPEQAAALIKEIKSVCDADLYFAPSNKLSLAAASAVCAIAAGADGIKTACSKDFLSCNTLSDLLFVKGEELGVSSTLDCTLIHNTVSSIFKNEVASDESISINKVADIDQNTTYSDLLAIVKDLGYELSAEDSGKVYEEFKRVASKKNGVAASELEAIIATAAMQVPSTYHLNNYVVNSGNIITATATITLEKDGEMLCGVSTGDGPIDAVFHAIEQIIGHHYELDDFQIQAVTKGREAVGSSLIKLRADGKLYSGNGVSTDIIGACVRAYINALNKIVYEQNER